MKSKICKWVKAITFGLVCFEWCLKPDVCDQVGTKYQSSGVFFFITDARKIIVYSF